MSRSEQKIIDRTISVAPMLDWTDRHCRYFLRLISPNALLFSEMVTTGAILYGDVERHLAFNSMENPIVLQLGGSDPAALAEAAKIGEIYGYDEINLNVGCPSSRVQSGAFGACLMAKPELVGQCVAAMREVVSLPVSVKCRIGIDDQDSESEFAHFVDVVAQAGCEIFYVHARKAWLEGLSPKQNRDVPPLDYERVYRLKAARPDLQILLNGGLQTIEDCQLALKHLDGIMIGRQAYHHSWWLRELDIILGRKASACQTRDDVLARMIVYARKQMAEGVRLHDITRHMMGLYHGQKGARSWRQSLSYPENSLANMENMLASARERSLKV